MKTKLLMLTFVCDLLLLLLLLSDIVFCCDEAYRVSENKEGFCEATPAKNDCHDDSQLNIPASWVGYLHSFEEAKLSKQCKGDAFVEDVAVHCSYAETIKEDLKDFLKISRDHLEQARQADRQSVTYRMVSDTLWRSQECLFPSRCEGIENFLLKMKKEVSDFEIVVNTHDWPYINHHFYSNPVPLFSFSKTVDHTDIFFPAWTFWAGGPAIKHYPTGLGRWDLMREKLLVSSKTWPWHKKLDKAFFRGSRTSSERDNLIFLSNAKPDVVDAKYTKNQAWRSVKDTLGMHPAAEVVLEDHCKFKYLFNFRGVAASFRHKHLFLCGSLVFHVGDDWYEFYYSGMKPWLHYIPVPSDASVDELEDLILFAQNYPAISEEIARNGKFFIENHLNLSDVENYWRALLKSYSKKLDFKVEQPSAEEMFVKIK